MTKAEISNVTANSATVTATIFNPNSSSLEVFLRFPRIVGVDFRRNDAESDDYWNIC